MGQQQSTFDSNLIVLKDSTLSIPKQSLSAMTDEKLGYIYLGGGRWQKYEVDKYTSYIREWNIKKGLVLDSNFQPQIFKQILDIKFEFLLELSVRQNNIQSIEIVSRIYMPLIEKLYFCQNKISCIRSLRRFNAPNLIFLSFNGNQALETHNLTYLEAEYLQELFIQLEGKKNKESSIIAINSFAKIKSKYLCKIWLGNYHIQKQLKCYKVLKQKFKGFQMAQFDKKNTTQCQYQA